MNIYDFIHEISWDDLPPAVRRQARRSLLDTVGTAVGGRATPLSQIVYAFAAANFGGNGPGLWLDGRRLSPVGAALAHASTVDALDAHDGYRPGKGHAGVAVIPAALATAAERPGPASGRELLATIVVGYEIALRAGEALHASTSAYHTSGAWNALGAAAVSARQLGLDQEQTAHALGIAEYHGPRSPMMRCIEHPTMLKDGSGWGALGGVSAGLLAAAGFTGAPAETVTGAQAAPFWQDLGRRWRLLDLYYKPYAVCRWAQPAIRAALALQAAHRLDPATVVAVEVSTFAAAVSLGGHRPRTTEEAQYSLPFPLAVALLHGDVPPAALTGAGLHEPAVLALAERIQLAEDPALSARFPAERYARVSITTADGATYKSGETTAAWEPEAPPSDEELRQKFRALTHPLLPRQRAEQLETLLWHCADLPDVAELLATLTPPIPLLNATTVTRSPERSPNLHSPLSNPGGTK